MCVVAGVVVTLLLHRYFQRRSAAKQNVPSDAVFGPPLLNNPRYFPDESEDPTTVEQEAEQAPSLMDPATHQESATHSRLEQSISLGDRIALARFVITMCGFGPYRESLNRLDSDYPPRMKYLRTKVTALLRKTMGLNEPGLIPDQDAELVFEELAHNAAFLELCKECVVLLRGLLDYRYRGLSDQHGQDVDVIHSDLLPSDEALKLLAD